MRQKILISIIVFMLFPLTVDSFASTSGSINEVVGNENMQIYVISVEETAGPLSTKLVTLEVILKNIELNPRAFNVFYVAVIDSNGNGNSASPMMGSVMPIRIPSDDILRGMLGFPLPNDVDASMLVWKEFDGSEIVIDLTKTKSPPDPLLKSEWVLSSNRGTVLSDGRTQLTVYDEFFNVSPPYYLVDISLKNLTSEVLHYGATFFFIKDNDGYMYPVDIGSFKLLKNPITRGKLNQGQEVRGELFFMLPNISSRIMLIYDEKIGDGSYFAVPEFSNYVMILIVSIGASLFLARRLKIQSHTLNFRT